MRCKKLDCTFHHYTPNGRCPKTILCNKLPDCKFGNRCNFSHIQPQVPNDSNIVNLGNLSG